MDARKRALGSDSQEVRLSYAREQLLEKKRTNIPADRQHEYLLCFTCISDGFPKTNYKHGQVIHRRDKLKDHYRTHHPTIVPQEWNLTSDNYNAPPKKQPKLNFFTSTKKDDDSIHGNPPTNTLFNVHESTSTVPKFSEASTSSQSSSLSTRENLQDDLDLQDKSQEETQKEEHTSSSLFTKIFNCVLFIKTKVCEIYSLVKLIAEKHRVSTNPLMLDYGRYATLENNEILIDGDGIQKALKTCKDIMEVFVYLPFLGLDEMKKILSVNFVLKK